MYYFASDMHLGLGSRDESLVRERQLVSWLEKVSADAGAIFIVGDMFDFWYEYKRVIPKGFSRLLGALSNLTDRGVEIHFFPGNHDLWAYDYLQTECGVQVHHKAEVFELYGKRLFITHGDDIHARNFFWARIMNSIFRSRVARWIFSHTVHPNSALRFGLNWSSHSRKSKSVSHVFFAENDPMVKFARAYDKQHIDYFVFGHNHCAEVYPIDKGRTTVFLGQWIEDPTYATLSPDGTMSLHKVGGTE